MFWKKKRSNSIFLAHEKNEKRSSFRYIPPGEAPLKAIVGKTEYHIINISASGLAFKKRNHLKEGSSHRIQIEIPGKAPVFDIAIKICFIDNEEICHCEFTDLKPEMADEIHQYVFERQMIDIRKGIDNRLE